MGLKSNRLAWRRASMERGGLPVCPGHVACNSTRTRHGILAVDAERGRREVPGAAAPRQCVQRRPNASMSVARCRRWLAAAGAGVRLTWALSAHGQEIARNEGRGGQARMRRAIPGVARGTRCARACTVPRGPMAATMQAHRTCCQSGAFLCTPRRGSHPCKKSWQQSRLAPETDLHNLVVHIGHRTKSLR